MTLKQLYEQASRRSSNEWREFFAVYRNRTRVWVQAHGELAAVFGFFAGILIVLFFRLFLWTVFFIYLAAGLLWLSSREDGD